MNSEIWYREYLAVAAQLDAMTAERDALRAVLAKIRRDYSSAFMPEDAARIDAALKGDGDE